MSENSVKKFIEAINTEDVDAAITIIKMSKLLDSNNWLCQYKFLKQDKGDKNDSGMKCNSNLNLLRLLLHRASKGFVTKLFRRAVKYGYTMMATFLLEDVPNKIDVNVYDEDGKTALQAACVYRSSNLMYILLDHDADIHAKCEKPSILGDDDNEFWERNFGKTALHFAAAYGKPEMIQILLTCGADVHATDAAGSTCLHLACLCVVSVAVLLEAGANCNVKDNRGRTPLHVTVEDSLPYYCAVGYEFPHVAQAPMVHVIKQLLKEGADVNIICNDAMTPLDYALSAEDLGDGVDVLKNHIIAMKALDLYVSDGNLKHIDLNGKDLQTFEECKEELAVKICRSKISFYDFLTGSTKQLVVYLQDKNLCEALEKITGIENICCKDHRMICCPLYQNIIVKRYRQVKERKLLVRSGLKPLKIALVELFGKELPEDIVLEVVEYCSNEQLKHLIKSADSES